MNYSNKPQSQNKYMEDDELNSLCLDIIHYSSILKESKNKPLRDRLWDGACYLYETSTGNESFHNRILFLGEDNKAEAMYDLFNDCITTIVKKHSNKEKSKLIQWNESQNLDFNGLLFRESVDGKQWSLKSFTEVLIGSKTDFKKLLTMLNVTLKEITLQQFNRLLSNIRLNPEGFNQFKTLKIVYEPFEISQETTTTISENIIYDLERGFVRKEHPAEKFRKTPRGKSQQSTLDIFDGF